MPRVVHRASARGVRRTMEDRDVVVDRVLGGRLVTLLGVWDGHGGAEVAELAASRFAPACFDALATGRDAESALLEASRAVSAAVAGSSHVGSTACTALLSGPRLTVAWVGDSQLAVVTPERVRLVTAAHRVDHPAELARIRACGGSVQGDYVMRGEHGLMVTRALGDEWFAPVGIVATPETATLEIDADVPHLVVLATDGLWDVMPPDGIVAMFAAHGARIDVDYAQFLVNEAFTAHTHDNVTVVAAALHGPQDHREPPPGARARV